MRKVIEIKVKPNSSKSEIKDRIVCVRAKAEGGKANLEVVKLFSKKYKNVKILNGFKSSRKLISFED